MKTYQFKLYRHKRQKKLHRQINIAGYIYNHCIALHKRHYRLYGKYITIYSLQRHLTKLKHIPKYHFWSELGSQAIQEITERIDKGYKRFFAYLKNKSTRKISPPGFKKVRKYKSFTLKQAGWALEGNRLRIGKNYFGYFASRPIEGTVKTVTLKRDACGDIFVFFACEVNEQAELPMTGKIAGFDFGLHTFLTSSKNHELSAPLFLKQGLRKLKAYQKALSGKKIGSHHRDKAKLKVAKLHRHIANQRKNYHFELARSLCFEYDVMIFEDLNMKGMQALWGRKISDLGFSKFLEILGSRAAKYGRQVHFVDRYFPSSKTCSRCGHKKEHLSLRDRIFQCDCCGLIISRDKNAAINLERVGALTLGLDTVRPDDNSGKCRLTPESPSIMFSV